MGKGAYAVGSGALGLRLLSPLKNPSALQKALQELSRLYIMGLLYGALMFRSSRAGFLRVFPKLPSPQLREVRFRLLAAAMGRELLFLTLGPIFAFLTVLTFFFGGGAIEKTSWPCCGPAFDIP